MTDQAPEEPRVDVLRALAAHAAFEMVSRGMTIEDVAEKAGVSVPVATQILMLRRSRRKWTTRCPTMADVCRVAFAVGLEVQFRLVPAGEAGAEEATKEEEP